LRRRCCSAGDDAKSTWTSIHGLYALFALVGNVTVGSLLPVVKEPCGALNGSRFDVPAGSA